MNLKRICAMTMVRNDSFFLSRWVAYYGACLGKENLFVYLDGEDQELPEDCRGVNLTVRPHEDMKVAAGDRDRARFLSAEAAQRFGEGYQRVIGTDVDEFLAVDPSLNMSLPEFLSQDFKGYSLSGLGVDVGQHLTQEKELDCSAGFLEQREYGFLNPRYTKACVLLRPAVWGSGFHRVKRRNFRIAAGLYLFHFGSVDFTRLRLRSDNAELIGNGWSHHLMKRSRTIRIVSSRKAAEWDRIIDKVRIGQQLCRPAFAWNKPTLFGSKIVVRIPGRFSGIV